MAKLSDAEWRFFVSLWLESDDYGNFEASPERLEGGLFWGRKLDDAGQPRDLLSLMAAISRFVLWYEIGGELYGHVRNWTRHQRVDKPGKPHVPGPKDADNTVNPDERMVSRDVRERLATVLEGGALTCAPARAPDLDQDQDQEGEGDARAPTHEGAPVREADPWELTPPGEAPSSPPATSPTRDPDLGAASPPPPSPGTSRGPVRAPAVLNADAAAVLAALREPELADLIGEASEVELTGSANRIAGIVLRCERCPKGTASLYVPRAATEARRWLAENRSRYPTPERVLAEIERHVGFAIDWVRKRDRSPLTHERDGGGAPRGETRERW
jgi:hypothetical protein